jgi:hypothetical protein
MWWNALEAKRVSDKYHVNWLEDFKKVMQDSVRNACILGKYKVEFSVASFVKNANTRFEIGDLCRLNGYQVTWKFGNGCQEIIVLRWD